ncbi:MAG: hypothetical protein EOM47_01230 [Bacteroidia bacterium]|nr:hypothetical protein [Bacteroidia bacterium]
MAKQTLNILKNWFRTGLKPTQAQFWDWMDSFFHKDEKIPLTSIDGIQEEFDKKADKGLIQISDVENLEETLESLSTGGVDLSDYATKTELATKVDKNGTDRLITQTEAAKLAGINEHWRGSYQTLTALKTAIPVANPGDEATIDAGVGTQAQKAIWDETDQDWYISSGTPVTVDQAINEGSINAVAGGAVFNALQNTNSAIDNKVDKNGTDRLLTQAEAALIEGMSPIEFEVTDVINGIIIPESPTKLYRISTATDLTVTINTGLLDLTKYIKLFIKINLNDYVVLTFPENWYFANLAIPTEVGEYLYEVSSSDGGYTWRASLRYKNIATVGIAQEGDEIVGAKLLFVDGEKADNSGNGLTWLTAKKDVQAAIDIANTGDAVFVKGKLDGLKYLPTTERTPGTARSKSFVMKAGVNVYGGFMGIESTLYERQMVRYPQTMNLPTGTFTMYVDIPKYRSILSGEIAGDSIINPAATVGNQFTTASIANNSYLVVLGVSNTVMNGFEVIGGNSIVDGCAGVLGGILVNSKVYNNSAIPGSSNGGGIRGVKAISCLITNNSSSSSMASQSAGGVMGGDLTNCVIAYNVGNSGSNGANSATLTNCAIYGNTSGGGATTGGLYSCTATNCVIYSNSGGYSGGVRGGSVTNCSIYNNTTTGGGGGLNSVTANSCFVYNNMGSNGGGIYGGTVTNCSIYNNSSTNGGGVYGIAILINCSVVKNRATVGSGTYNCTLKNTVVYGNRTGAGVISNVYNDAAQEELYSAFEDEVRAGTGNISLSMNNEGDVNSPCFQSLSNDSGVVDEVYVSNLKILNDSYLIDKGLDSYLTTGYGSLYDVESKPRKVDTIDIGAYENQKTV